jgi:hypothetical protein
MIVSKKTVKKSPFITTNDVYALYMWNRMQIYIEKTSINGLKKRK